MKMWENILKISPKNKCFFHGYAPFLVPKMAAEAGTYLSQSLLKGVAIPNGLAQYFTPKLKSINITKKRFPKEVHCINSGNYLLQGNMTLDSQKEIIFRDIGFILDSEAHLSISNGPSVKFINCKITVSKDIDTDKFLIKCRAKKLMFDNCYFEGNASNVSMINHHGDLTIKNCFFKDFNLRYELLVVASGSLVLENTVFTSVHSQHADNSEVVRELCVCKPKPMDSYAVGLFGIYGANSLIKQCIFNNCHILSDYNRHYMNALSLQFCLFNKCRFDQTSQSSLKNNSTGSYIYGIGIQRNPWESVSQTDFERYIYAQKEPGIISQNIVRYFSKSATKKKR